MAKIIEVTGPAGVGKTTILNGLTQSWNGNADWILNHKLFPRKKISLLNISSIAQNLPHLVKFGKANLDNKVFYETGRRFIMQNSAFIDAYWDHQQINYKRNFEGYDSRFDTSAHFYDKLKKYQFIKEHSTSKYVLFDEGLVHHLAGRVPMINNTLQESTKDIDSMIQVMPMPAALLYIDTDIDIIMERLASRKKVLPIHMKKSNEEIRQITQLVKRRMGYIKDQLLEKDIPVLSIDSKEDIRFNTEKINQFISQLKAKAYA